MGVFNGWKQKALSKAILPCSPQKRLDVDWLLWCVFVLRHLIMLMITSSGLSRRKNRFWSVMMLMERIATSSKSVPPPRRHSRNSSRLFAASQESLVQSPRLHWKHSKRRGRSDQRSTAQDERRAKP